MRGSTLSMAIACWVLVAPTQAHHSSAMFDTHKSVELKGTVKLFQWTNPHCWIQVLVPANSGAIEWSVQMGSTAALYRGGWRPGTLKPGDKIAIVVHPMRDGTTGGLFVSTVPADRRALGDKVAGSRP
ncbi:MAG: DUF6152 family protein [Steroidobacteraceae bacterium]